MLDLRQPRAADWFVHYFSRLEMQANQEEDTWVRCWPYRPPLDSFAQILPTLLTQERGGGAFALAVGSWLRQKGVNALIFPSARSDCTVEAADGELFKATGFNLVNYQESGDPRMRLFSDISDYWEEKVRTGLGLGVGSLRERDPFERVQIDYITGGTNAGSWRVRGIVTIKAAVLDAQIKALSSLADESELNGDAWIDELPLSNDIKSWVRAFVQREYLTCANWGLGLLPTIESFEVLQIFLLSLQRLNATPVEGGWNAAEIIQQLAPQILVSHEHLPRLHALLEITLGIRVPDSLPEEIADAATRTAALYYGGARLISLGQERKARVLLEASIRNGGEGLEAHLAYAELAALKSE